MIIVFSYSTGFISVSSYHQIAVSRLIQFSRYLCARNGPQLAKSIISNVIDRWNEDRICQEFPLVNFLTDSIIQELDKPYGWHIKGRRIKHKIRGKCTPRNWAGVVLEEKEKYEDCSFCKKCWQ